MEQIIAKGRSLVDSYGRERIFNGMNVCDKGRYVPEADKRVYGELWKKGTAKQLKQGGIELIRLGFVWDAVEPEMGRYNDAFLDELKVILDECAEAGVYAYLDMHQDLYGGYGEVAGDGAPGWAAITGKYKFRKPVAVWAEGYFWGKAVHTAFDNFWNNTNLCGKGIQDRYVDMWCHVAMKLGSHEAVIGFDVMNEPFPGSDGGVVFRKIICKLVSTTIFDKSISLAKLIKLALNSAERPKVLDFYGGEQLRKITSVADGLIKNFDLKKYSPFLNRTTKAIRKINTDKMMFMENSYYSNLGIPYSCPVPEVDGKKDEKVVFAPHAYDFMVDTPEYKYANNGRVKSIFDEHKRSQERLDVPLIVGEWGGFTDGNEWFHHIKFLLELFDSNKWSHTYWAFFNGLLESELFNEVLKRPHPVAVTGRIESYCHDREKNTFELNYEQDAEFDVPTEVFLHKTPVSIETDGEYEIEKYDGGDTAMLKIRTGMGRHSVKVAF